MPHDPADHRGPAPASEAVDSGARITQLFDFLCDDPDSSVSLRRIAHALTEAGIDPEDLRLGEYGELIAGKELADSEWDRPMSAGEFERAIGHGISLVERALRRELVIPDFAAFREDIGEIFEATAGEKGGVVASYIPQLARVNPELAAFGLCTIDGQRMAFGDTDERFCLQSTSKPISYCLALEDEGPERVHRHVGREPSGQSFNNLALNHEGLPHNPMINAGAIMVCALIGRHLPPSDRFEHVKRVWTRLTGGVEPTFDEAVYESERKTADRNFALGYFMREHGAFPEGTDLIETLDFYFRCCSLELNVRDFSVVAAALANGGICPLTEERIFGAETVRNTLSLMYSCGMYDFSGEWAFTVGLPAKSGVSGVILVVIPNTLGFAVWAPRLDTYGNSVRGIALCQELIRRFNFHHYDRLVGDPDGKPDPRRDALAHAASLSSQLLWAASKGDLAGMRRLAVRGVDLEQADYDGRTPLHLAASAGEVRAVRYLLAQGVRRDPIDRWGGTPAADAQREGHLEVAALLQE
jgi:glutaminase